jgi:hypothetical protein
VTPLKTLSYASVRPEIVEGNDMKTVADCLEEIQNAEHDKYPYTLALTDFIDPDRAEGMLRALCQTIDTQSGADRFLFASSLAVAICEAMKERAESMSQASVTPLDNDTNESDVRSEQ